MDFFEVIKNRRSVRLFDGSPVPRAVMARALEAALLAPNSSNMQTWEFYWVKDTEKRDQLVKACLGQSAATTAQELVVAAIAPHKWRHHAQVLAQTLEEQNAPVKVQKYYKNLMPFVYGMQYLAPFKWLIFNTLGLFKPTPRRPWSWRDREEVCIKSSALACENFMLAIAAQGFDTCPMEGFDEARVAKIVDLHWSGRIVMVIAVGKRLPSGVWGEQIRFPKDWVLKEI